VTDVWVPEFEGQRPPFQPGNRVSVGNRGLLKHGAYSPRRVDSLATEIMTSLLGDEDLAYLGQSRWRLSLLALCRAEAQVQLFSEYIADAALAAGNGVGDLTAEDMHAAYLGLHRAEARATTQRTRLGLDPLSASRLGAYRASEALDTARLMQQLEKAERDQRGKGEDGDDGPE
jgi:hypothetical protein